MGLSSESKRPVVRDFEADNDVSVVGPFFGPLVEYLLGGRLRVLSISSGSKARGSLLAVVDALKRAIRSLETLHEMDASRALAYFDKVPPPDADRIRELPTKTTLIE
jgi:hypothetical protein